TARSWPVALPHRRRVRSPPTPSPPPPVGETNYYRSKKRSRTRSVTLKRPALCLRTLRDRHAARLDDVLPLHRRRLFHPRIDPVAELHAVLLEGVVVAMAGRIEAVDAVAVGRGRVGRVVARLLPGGEIARE